RLRGADPQRPLLAIGLCVPACRVPAGAGPHLLPDFSIARARPPDGCGSAGLARSHAPPAMPHDSLSLEELAAQLGRDKRELEKLVSRGRIPGRRVEGVWRFHPSEIRMWLEQEIRGYTTEELAAVEELQRTKGEAGKSPLTGLFVPETVQVPLEARTRRSVLEALLEVAGRTWQLWEPALLLGAILEREEVLSTGFENGVAIPHPRNPLPQALGTSVVA